ncbi:hypothetical protein FSP39_006437 [Pinctada imbricata]|uniref:Lariat debranching enzyme C-terminal domain-containing protein n=1 Tax=Pinctada imbricata TaxID=66713 RepID=A0AA88XCP0_PINIB|nr:hypothetical protein FSP39_006437 [Pinctada imbricata]
MKIAVEGCCHGELDKIYETLQYIERRNGIKVDLLLICGDFQAVRNKEDLQCMAVSQKYQKMNTFYKYYSGEKIAPYLTVFIGGNHEASNYMQELPYGGWVAPNIYYMGYASVIQFGGVRIAGLSGIHKGRDSHKGHYEHPPYNGDTMRTAYHTREFEVFRLKQISRPLDIFLSHDWPRGIYNYGNTELLLKRKSFFREEVESNTLGSPQAEELLYKLKPDYWFAAHLHVKFAALVQHQMDNGAEKITKFLSLDKCLPKRKFLQILDIPQQSDKPLKIELDPEWLVILKSTNHLLNLTRVNKFMPGPGSSDRWDYTVTQEEMNEVLEDFGGDLTLPENFERTAPIYDPSESTKKSIKQPQIQINPQTTLLCTMLELTDPNAVFLGKDSHIKLDTLKAMEDSETKYDEKDEIDDDDDNPSEYESEASFMSMSENSFMSSSMNESRNISINPDEIRLSDDEEERKTQEKNLDSKDDSLVEGELSISDDEEFKEMLEKQREYQSSSSADEKSASPMKTSNSVSSKEGFSTPMTSTENVSLSTSETVNEKKGNNLGRKFEGSGENVSQKNNEQRQVVQIELAEGGDLNDDDDPGDILLLKPQPDLLKIESGTSVFHSSPKGSRLCLPPVGGYPSSSPSSGEERSDSEVTRETKGLRLSIDRGLNRRSEDSSGSPLMKKFKRRNQQLYTDSGEGD